MLEKVQADRAKKLQAIRDLGIDPYGGRYGTAEAIATIRARHVEGREGQPADAAGRLVLIRDMGKMIFAHIRDQTDAMQIALRKDALDEKTWQLVKLLDLGDIIAVAGPLQPTRTGELTIWAAKLTLLTKSLNPMPEKFHGLVDVEARYRQRYLDLMTNPDSMARFRKRVAIIQTFRDVLKNRGFMEVETPVLQAIYGGGAAKPFTTHHNTLDTDLFLRISPELYLKRLLVGGMEKVFEIGRNFRNEGIDTRHNPEFTMLELYQAYADYEVMMEITEELIVNAAAMMSPLEDAAEAVDAMKKLQAQFDEWERGTCAILEDLVGSPRLGSMRKRVIDAVSAAWSAIQHPLQGYAVAAEKNLEAASLAEQGKIALPFGERVIDYSLPWPRMKYADLLAEHAGVDMADAAAVREKARKLGIEEQNKDDAVVINEVFEAAVEPALAKMDRPVFVLDWPADICPLTRRRTDDPATAMRFELYIAGMEIANAYTELNDPEVQERNFLQQLRGEGDAAAMRVMDRDFVTALRHGMPPAGGLGIGMDRVVMLLTGTTSIRDVVLFPMLRPETKT
jgi:lysyl-tRNA synthetase class 2